LKVCVTAVGASLDAQVDLRFGRCAYFMIVDTSNMKFEALPNVGAGAMHGAGVQAAQMVVNKGVQVVITGSVGPNAHQVLSAAGIKIIAGAVGTVREVVDRYKSGQLQEGADLPNVPAHFGVGMGRGTGRRLGMGRRGMRAFSGASYQSTCPQPIVQWQPPEYSYQEPIYDQPAPPTSLKPQDELASLEDYRKKLGDELRSIEARTKELKDLAQKIPKINLNTCNGCGACINACPNRVLGLVNGKARVIHAEACTNCGLCTNSCPNNAIEIQSV